MKKIIFTFILFLSISLVNEVRAYIPPDLEEKREQLIEQRASLRSDCAPATGEIDLNINNVRARLMTGGDLWWDLDGDARYVVPNVRAPQPEVSSLFAGGVWIGGFDDEGNLKLAAQTYRRPNANDWWPGPLTPGEGSTFAERCQEWDRMFRVTSDDIREHKRNIATYIFNDMEYPPELIPDNIKYWPALGNPFWNERFDFELPFNDQGLGNFFDFEENGIYDPSQGDFPFLDIRGCDKKFDDRVPDEMYFYIYNDAGGVHTRSGGDVIRMEVQVQAFAYATQDEINNMTFYRHKLINRAPTPIDSTYFAMWVDADLGCPFDDYIGSEPSLDFKYIYNETAIDGSSPGSCECGSIPTYCRNIPALGVDYFRGPIDLETGEEIGMTSFMYHNNPGGFTGPSATTDPTNATEYYRYLTGHWRDGRPLTEGGDGYRTSGGVPTSYAFPDEPNDPNGWSMCTAGLEQGDRRTIQASGPFRLFPGAVNELIVGVVWVPDIPHPCPDLTRLFNADRTAQALFDNCFIFPEGPDAPDMFPIELDREVIFTMVNDTLTSNNAFLRYEEKGLKIPEDEPDSLYFFEGYQVFQLKNAAVEPTRESFEDMSRARLVFQTDIQNDITTIYNWEPLNDPFSADQIYIPKRMVAGNNTGLRHSFRVTEDVFADGDRSLINHKKYYYAVVAYGHNDFEEFSWREPESGQEQPYLEGNGNVRVYTVVPRPTVYKNLNAAYGDGVPITRLAGFGTGNNFLELEEGLRESIVDGTFDGELRYADGAGPVDIQIYNPLDVVDGEYELRFTDGNPDSDVLEADATWEVINLNTGEVVASQTTVELLNEELIGKFGFSVTIGQVPPVGSQPFLIENNGFLGGFIEYKDPLGPQWLNFVPDLPPGGEDDLSSWLDYIKTELDNEDFALDPNRSFISNNETGFYPYCIMDYRPGNMPMISPAWINNANRNACLPGFDLANLGNVDIVFTSDKSKWSRSVIVEANTSVNSGAINFRGLSQFDLVRRPAASKEAGSDGLPLDDPDLPDGFAWFPGYAVDVETGKRLNIFFSENTIFSPDNAAMEGVDESLLVGDDRMWNPTATIFEPEEDLPGNSQWHVGGHHFIYVTDMEYDGSQEVYNILTGIAPPPIRMPQLLRRINWAAMPLATDLLSYDEGLIPNDAVIKLRVTKEYQVSERTADGNKGYNRYYFKIEGKQAEDLIENEFEDALANINVVPNPYYAFSEYEETSFDNRVKITNVPDLCTVTIYTLDGKFVRRYERNTGREGFDIRVPSTLGRLPSSAIEWDLRNNAGIPVSSGIYLIHIEAPGLGERVIKWFGVSRQFDPSGL